MTDNEFPINFLRREIYLASRRVVKLLSLRPGRRNEGGEKRNRVNVMPAERIFKWLEAAKDSRWQRINQFVLLLPAPASAPSLYIYARHQTKNILQQRGKTNFEKRTKWKLWNWEENCKKNSRRIKINCIFTTFTTILHFRYEINLNGFNTKAYTHKFFFSSFLAFFVLTVFPY